MEILLNQNIRRLFQLVKGQMDRDRRIDLFSSNVWKKFDEQDITINMLKEQLELQKNQIKLLELKMDAVNQKTGSFIVRELEEHQ